MFNSQGCDLIQLERCKQPLQFFYERTTPPQKSETSIKPSAKYFSSYIGVEFDPLRNRNESAIQLDDNVRKVLLPIPYSSGKYLLLLKGTLFPITWKGNPIHLFKWA